MLDYVDMVVYCKDRPCFDRAIHFSSTRENQGEESYRMIAANGMQLQIYWNESMMRLEVQGSLPYYHKGYNWSFSIKELEEAVNHLGCLLGVSLWGAELKEFEYGCIFQIHEDSRQYIKNHVSSGKLKRILNDKYKGSFVLFQCPDFDIKIYDPVRRFKGWQRNEIRPYIMKEGWVPGNNYLKVEVRYLNPCKLLNDWKGMRLEMLVNPDWVKRICEDVLTRYQVELKPLKEIVEPESKKDLSALDIATRLLAKEFVNGGRSLDELKKALYQEASSHSGLLTKADMDSRKATMKKALAGIHEEVISRWDLSEFIRNTLCVEYTKGP